ncbi:MAG: hypothetical protein JWN46_340, partial [Acidimicrobiales bacterium]|nr:hypothetical protein [Acidimicrobiales bacterium]
MLRRRHPAALAEPPAPAAPAEDPRDLHELAAAGWLLPRAASDGRWTWIGTLDSPTTTLVDGAGLVAPGAGLVAPGGLALRGWALDWWIGADDRWHLPAREPSVRQRLIGDAPVVETLVRIPGGDAVHRAYAIRGPGGAEQVVVEVENRSTIPFAVALAVRPFDPAGRGRIEEITIEPTGGGQGRDVAHLVRVDGRPAMVVPRAPARAAVGSRAGGDV